jgi:carbonic anhydrase/acetyltransferase-like protein (isoleucine patch superfamily)
MKKYKLTNNTIQHEGKTLYQIQALKGFGYIYEGELGGYVESESNLSQEGDCWVYGNAKIYGDAQVFGDAKVFGNAKVFDSAWVSDNAQVFGNAKVYGNVSIFNNTKVYKNAQVYNNAKIYGDVSISGNVKVYDNAEVYGKTQVFSNAQISGNAKVYGNARVWGDSQFSHGKFLEDLYYRIHQYEGNQIVYSENPIDILIQIEYKNQTYNLNKRLESKEEIIEKALQLYKISKTNNDLLEGLL